MLNGYIGEYLAKIWIEKCIAENKMGWGKCSVQEQVHLGLEGDSRNYRIDSAVIDASEELIKAVVEVKYDKFSFTKPAEKFCISFLRALDAINEIGGSLKDYEASYKVPTAELKEKKLDLCPNFQAIVLTRSLPGKTFISNMKTGKNCSKINDKHPGWEKFSSNGRGAEHSSSPFYLFSQVMDDLGLNKIEEIGSYKVDGTRTLKDHLWGIMEEQLQMAF